MKEDQASLIIDLLREIRDLLQEEKNARECEEMIFK